MRNALRHLLRRLQITNWDVSILPIVLALRNRKVGSIKDCARLLPKVFVFLIENQSLWLFYGMWMADFEST